jgi:hypothetical protein
MGVCGYRGYGDSRPLVLGVSPSGGNAETRNGTCCRRGGQRMDVRGDLLWSLATISLIPGCEKNSATHSRRPDQLMVAPSHSEHSTIWCSR